MPVFVDDESFFGKDFSKEELPQEFNGCSFTSCNFSEVDLQKISFAECHFRDCDLSNAHLQDTSFNEVHFENCKLLGLRFDRCSPFLLSFTFKDCILNFSSFYKLKIPKSNFSGCKMEQVDFSEADLRNAIFDTCNLSGAIFNETNLEGTDLSTSQNFSIDPEENKVSKAIFSRDNLAGLLEKYNLQIK